MLGHLPNLEKLNVACPQTLPDGSLEAICKISSLRSLNLFRSKTPAREYASLTNLTQLDHLVIGAAPGFGDNELRQLKALPSLKRLELHDVGISDAWAGIVRPFPALTNAVVVRSSRSSESVTWETQTWSKESHSGSLQQAP